MEAASLLFSLPIPPKRLPEEGAVAPGLKRLGLSDAVVAVGCELAACELPPPMENGVDDVGAPGVVCPDEAVAPLRLKGDAGLLPVEAPAFPKRLVPAGFDAS